MNIQPHLQELNQIFFENDGAYRYAARGLGITESALWVLYTLRTEAPPVTSKLLCEKMHTPKQTMHSILKSLEAGGYVSLGAGEDRRTRVVLLTLAGEELARRTADRVVQAEEAALFSLDPGEAEEFLRLYRKYTQLLRLCIHNAIERKDEPTHADSTV